MYPNKNSSGVDYVEIDKERNWFLHIWHCWQQRKTAELYVTHGDNRKALTQRKRRFGSNAESSHVTVRKGAFRPDDFTEDEYAYIRVMVLRSLQGEIIGGGVLGEDVHVRLVKQEEMGESIPSHVDVLFHYGSCCGTVSGKPGDDWVDYRGRSQIIKLSSGIQIDNVFDLLRLVEPSWSQISPERCIFYVTEKVDCDWGYVEIDHTEQLKEILQSHARSKTQPTLLVCGCNY